ncbi:hypothetical protein TRFO_17173 [Tritrichomonas foetus]|uniref:Uncharacterized protein n=1 Tax=Tritrichomonas foetus TaxID=1144522 RepID=A0A1J4KTK6_9EUKA|nr:hypothetical protein TRFO_17173 [Tritrichomonas foetus]|eukprot:OHT12821.1 hypothetical protein TRFO_17173 [Tritrichomonas foetus]
MLSCLNFTLLSLSSSQFGLTQPNTRLQSIQTFSNIKMKYNFYYFFYSSNLEPSQKFHRLHFSNFLDSSIQISSLSFNRDDIYQRPIFSPSTTSNLTITESFFTNCSSFDGGAFFVVFNGPVIIEKSNFVNCFCSDKGGVLFMYGLSLSIKQTCFSQISAQEGFSIFCSRSKSKTLIENSHFFNNTGESSTVYVYGFDVEMKNNNCSHSKASSISTFSVAPSHSFIFTMQVFHECDGGNIIHLETTDSADTITNCIVVNCYLTSTSTSKNIKSDTFENQNNDVANLDSLFYFVDGTTVLVDWSFIMKNDKYVFSRSNDNSTLIISNSFFSAKKENVEFDDFTTIQDSVKFGDSTLIAINFINTQICWNQNRYKFREPKVFQKVIIAVIVIVLFVGAFVYMIVEACKDEKEHKDLLKQTEYNEALNNEIQLDDLDQLAKEKKGKEELAKLGNDGEGEQSD